MKAEWLCAIAWRATIHRTQLGAASLVNVALWERSHPGSTLPQKIILACARGETSQMLLGVYQQCQCQGSGPVLYSGTMRQGEVLPAKMAAEEQTWELLLSSGFCRPLLDCKSPQVSWDMEGCNAQECDAECLSVWWLEALAIWNWV